MLDTISKAEGTWGKDAYSTTFGGGKSDWRKGKDQTVRKGSSAHGKYQFMNDTWKRLETKLELTGFSPEEQDVAAFALLEETEAVKHLDEGEFDKAIYAAAPVWAALPKDASGQSAMKGQKAKPVKTVLNYMKSNDEAFKAKNDFISDLNAKNNLRKSPAEKQAILKRYNGFMKKINDDDSLSEAEKNKERQLIKNKYYRAGNFEIIQSENTKDYLEKTKLIGELEKSYKIIHPDEDDPGYGVKDFDQKKYNETRKKLLKYNIVVPEISKDNDAGLGGGNDFATLESVVNKAKSLNVNHYEQNQSKYGYTREEFDAELAKTAPVDTGIAADIENGTATVTDSPEEAKKKAEAEAAQKALDAKILAEKNKPFDGSATLNNLLAPDEFVGSKFVYKPGKFEIPFDALVSGATGLMGAAAADDVHIKYRDEKVAEGMLQYAEDIAKIKNMGLSPEIEGGLKMKLADAYQTGLTNIVRASNGNRNLVLGNQGQLDQARMSSLVEIAAMDVDRTDKAMAAFGEVQKYISEFDSRRDIANNERRYQEDQKTQTAGMAAAQQGMAGLIDGIRHAKENAPGSINDMRRQYFQFAATGISPGAEPGKPGSPQYKAAKEAEYKLFSGKKQTYADWIRTLNKEDQDVVASILIDNPQFDITKNPKAEFEDLKNSFNDISGNATKKNDYLKSKNIGQQTINDVAEKKQQAVDGTIPVKEVADTTARGHAPKTQEELYGTPIIGKDGSVTYSKEPKKPIKGGIVTTTNLSDQTIQEQLNKGVLGYSTGPGTIDQNSLLTPQEQRGEALDKKAEEYLKRNAKTNKIIDDITLKAEKEAADNALLNLVTKQKQ